MEQNSLYSREDAKSILEGQLRESYGRVVYSHKTHEKCAVILLDRLSIIKWIQIWLAVISTGSFVLSIFNLGDIGTAIGVIASTLLLGINTYTKDYDLGEAGQKHKQAANELWLIREKYLSLIADLAIGDKSIEDVQKSRDFLMEKLHFAYTKAPSTTSKAYKKAQESLKYQEEMTFSDKEIDAFLPKELKRSRAEST